MMDGGAAASAVSYAPALGGADAWPAC